MTNEELRREVRRLTAFYLVRHPEHLDMSEDIVRQAATEVVLRLERRRRDVPEVFRRAFEGEPPVSGAESS